MKIQLLFVFLIFILLAFTIGKSLFIRIYEFIRKDSVDAEEKLAKVEEDIKTESKKTKKRK